MAKDLVLTDRERHFATAAMLPVGEEDLNYIWGRKMAENALAATPTPLEWGTFVMEETGSAVFGSYTLTFDLDVWKNIPWIELWQIRGGTEIVALNHAYKHKNTAAGDRPNGIEVNFGVLDSDDGTIYLRYYPDLFAFPESQEVDFTGNRASFGTFLYRLS